MAQVAPSRPSSAPRTKSDIAKIATVLPTVVVVSALLFGVIKGCGAVQDWLHGLKHRYDYQANAHASRLSPKGDPALVQQLRDATASYYAHHVRRGRHRYVQSDGIDVGRGRIIGRGHARLVADAHWSLNRADNFELAGADFRTRVVLRRVDGKWRVVEAHPTAREIVSDLNRCMRYNSNHDTARCDFR